MAEFKLGFYTRSISKIYELSRTQDLVEYDLTSKQLDVLFFITCKFKKSYKVNQKNIEENFSLTKSTVSEIIKRLVSKDFIKKEVDTLDARNNYLIPTEKSLSIMNEARRKVIGVNDELLSGFSEEELKELQGYLERILENGKKGR